MPSAVVQGGKTVDLWWYVRNLSLCMGIFLCHRLLLKAATFWLFKNGRLAVEANINQCKLLTN